MKKEVSKIIKEKKTSLPEVMQKYSAYFLIEVEDGFAHIKIGGGGKMFVGWFDEDGYLREEENYISFNNIQKVADFMREMKELKLENYSK